MKAPLDIRVDDLRGAAIRALLREHLDDMRRITPPQSVHALGVDALASPEITVFSAWQAGALVGCGALRSISDSAGEIKAMRTHGDRRGTGVGSAILRHIVRIAQGRGYTGLYLETGSFDAFAAARAFYRRHGFRKTAPFAEYSEDNNSVFMVMDLEVLTDDGHPADDPRI